MRATRSLANLGTTGVAIAGATAIFAAPLTPITQTLTLPPAAHSVRLAAISVPPGGLVTSFLGNQVKYCSLICPFIVQGAVTVPIAILQTPGTFATALQSGNVIKAIGTAAASVTGAADAAATPAIDRDGNIVAPRAWNALEVAVVGLLDVVPAAAGGLRGVITAIENARADTFIALNAPLVRNPVSTATPRGVVQVVVVEGMNVVAAVIFPGLNAVLQGGFDTVDDAAQMLARTGDPVKAVASGAMTAAGALRTAGDVVAESVDTAVANIGSAIEQARRPSTQSNAATQDSIAGAKPVRAQWTNRKSSATREEFAATPQAAKGLRDVVSQIRNNVRGEITRATQLTHRFNSRLTAPDQVCSHSPR